MKGLIISLFFLNLYLQVSYEHYFNLEDFEADQIVPKSQLIQRASRAISTRAQQVESREESFRTKSISSEQSSNNLEGSGEAVQSLQQHAKRNLHQSLASGAEVSSEEESSGEEPNHRVKRAEHNYSALHAEIDQQGSGEQPESLSSAVNQAHSSKQKHASVETSVINEGSGQQEPE